MQTARFSSDLCSPLDHSFMILLASILPEQEKYQAGRSTLILEATAEWDLLSARVAETQAVVNYILAVLTFYKAEGPILERRGIEAVLPSMP